MYYESQIFTERPVSGPQEAAMLIKNRLSEQNDVPRVRCCEAMSFSLGDTKRFIVPDGHVDNPFVEVAVVDCVNDLYFQVESITAAWVESVDKLAGYFGDPEQYIKRKTAINFQVPAPEVRAAFDCGCCGNSFHDSVAYQQRFDQDRGYGICKACEKHYI